MLAGLTLFFRILVVDQKSGYNWYIVQLVRPTTGVSTDDLAEVETIWVLRTPFRSFDCNPLQVISSDRIWYGCVSSD